MEQNTNKTDSVTDKVLAQSEYEFFYRLVCLRSSQMHEDPEGSPSTPEPLTQRQKVFMTYLCLFKHRGYDIDNFEIMARKMRETGLFKTKRDISQFKHKLSAKMWIRSGTDMCKLPKNFIFDDELEYKIELNFNEHKEEDRT